MKYIFLGVPTSEVEEVIFVFFLCFSQDLCEFVVHCNKRHIFLCLFFLLTITGRSEAIIVELKELFVLNGTFTVEQASCGPF